MPSALILVTENLPAQHAALPIRRTATRRAPRHFGRLSHRGEVAGDARGVFDQREQLHPPLATLTSAFRPDLLNGVQVVTGRAVALAHDADGKVNRRTQDFTAIPYYAWANRGPGEMLVFIPNRETSARPQPLPTLASRP